jgi:enoyl-CoA hydratase/carnithine racemase
MTDSDRVLCTITDGVADVRFNRPEKRNALDPAMFAAIAATGEQLRHTPGVRAVVVSGEGASFCAGLDFSSFQAMAGNGDRAALAHEVVIPEDSPVNALGQHAVYVWRQIPAPVIAAVHGHALGGGFQLALGADLRIVHPNVQMSVLEIRWGLIPDMCGTMLLPPLVGLEAAKELTFTGRMIDGAEAVRLGLASRTADDPRAEALALARELAAKNPHALRVAKQLLENAGSVGLRDGYRAEQVGIRSLIGSPNQVEAVTAFFEKRPPVFAD